MGAAAVGECESVAELSAAMPTTALMVGTICAGWASEGGGNASVPSESGGASRWPGAAASFAGVRCSTCFEAVDALTAWCGDAEGREGPWDWRALLSPLFSRRSAVDADDDADADAAAPDGSM